MEIEAFADPWEQLRLLSDARRNAALHALLQRRAKGARVLDVGAGSGIWACAAAALGASEVVAVEPTALAGLVFQLVKDNGLDDRVEVLEASIEDLDADPRFDLAFGELLNADPYIEGVVETCRAASGWLRPGGHLAPRRLRVWAAAQSAPESTDEASAARDEVTQLGRTLALDVRALEGLWSTSEPYRHLARPCPVRGSAVVVHDVALPAEPPERVTVGLPVTGDAPVGGVTVWFEAELDDGIVIGNGPGQSPHYHQLVSSWGAPLAPVDGMVEVRFELDDERSLMAYPVRSPDGAAVEPG